MLRGETIEMSETYQEWMALLKLCPSSEDKSKISLSLLFCSITISGLAINLGNGEFFLGKRKGKERKKEIKPRGRRMKKSKSESKEK